MKNGMFLVGAAFVLSARYGCFEVDGTGEGTEGRRNEAA
jgi:hypothetical protein